MKFKKKTRVYNPASKEMTRILHQRLNLELEGKINPTTLNAGGSKRKESLEKCPNRKKSGFLFN